MNDLISDGPVDETVSVSLAHGFLFPQHHLDITVWGWAHLNAIAETLKHTGAPVCLQSPVYSCVTQLLVLYPVIFITPTL